MKMRSDTTWRFLWEVGLVEITNQGSSIEFGRSILTIVGYDASEKHVRMEHCNIGGCCLNIHLSATSSCKLVSFFCGLIHLRLIMTITSN